MSVNVCIDVREARSAPLRIVVEAHRRDWPFSRYEIWLAIPYGWAAHADEIDEAVDDAVREVEAFGW